MEYKIYNYVESVLPENSSNPPVDINYNILGLHKKRFFSKGELQKVEYYGSYDFMTKSYNDLILTENRIYNRDADGFVYKRDLTTTWYLLDGSEGESKSTEKYYSADESIKEGEIRRSNIVSRLKLEVFGLLGQSDAYDFLTKVFTELGLYRDGFKQSLIDKISGMNEGYLNKTIPGQTPPLSIRDYVIEELTF